MRIIMFNSILFAYLIAPSLWGADLPAPDSTQPSAKTVPWQNLLQPNGEKFSLYFTYERDAVAERDGVTTDVTGHAYRSSVPDRQVAPPVSVTDAEAFLDFLRKALPETDILKDEAIPNVVHIREKSLSTLPDYLLDKKVDFQFKGPFGDFIRKTISEGNGSFAQTNGGPIGSQMLSRATPVDVNVKDVPFRTMLTAAVPLQSNHVLWTCYARKLDGRTIAYFQAPRSVPNPTATVPLKAPTGRGITTQPSNRSVQP